MVNYLIIAGTNTIGQESAKLLIAQNHKVIITGKVLAIDVGLSGLRPKIEV